VTSCGYSATTSSLYSFIFSGLAAEAALAEDADLPALEFPHEKSISAPNMYGSIFLIVAIRIYNGHKST
jgi:hypothetical protein